MTTETITVNAARAHTIHNALEQIERARRELVALYLALPPDDPGYEIAVAETAVPGHLRGLAESLHSAHEFALNLRDELFDRD